MLAIMLALGGKVKRLSLDSSRLFAALGGV
jgi:hypothetical protein